MMKVTAFWIFPSGSFYLEQTHFTICVPLVKPFGPDIINWFLKSSLLMYYNCSCWLFKIHCMVVYIFPQEAKDWIYFVGRLQITGKAVFWFSELMELCWLHLKVAIYFTSCPSQQRAMKNWLHCIETSFGLFF